MALFAVCALNCVMPLVPTIHRSANYKKMSQVSVFLTVALFISACIVFPYNGKEAPNKVIWRQVYDLDNNTSLVTVKTMNGLEDVMNLVPAAKERECGPDPVSKNVLTQCVYKGAIPTIVVESKKSGEEIIKSDISKPEHHKEDKILLRSVHVKWTAKDSRLCSVVFPEDSPVVLMKLAEFPEPDEGYKSQAIQVASKRGMTAFKREYDQTWDLEITYEVQDMDAPALEGTLGCLYDEWDHNQIPAFTHMKDHLPEWALIGGGKGPGLLTIQKKIAV